MYWLFNDKKISSFFLRYKHLFVTIILLVGIHKIILGNKTDYSSSRFNKLANELRCPTCQGLSVKDSEATFSNIIKEKIIELIRSGKSNEEIHNFFVQRYGEWILRTPKKEGFNLILWILPGTGIFVGLFWVLFRFKIKEEKSQGSKIQDITPDEEKKIMEDLGRFEES